jgi:tetratricopeptide (TPR) repeat protein
VAVLFWFHPAVYLSLRHLRAERERACDDDVLDRGAKPSEYATQLLRMAALLSSIDRKSYPELALSGRDGLKGRLAAILAPRRIPGLRRRRIDVVLVAGAMFLIASLSVSSFWLENGRIGRSAQAYWASGATEKESDLSYAVEQALARGGWTSAYARLLESLLDGKIKLSSERMVGFGVRLLLEKGSFEEARSVFRLAVEVSPDSARRLEESGDRLLEKGDRAGAQVCYEMMVVLYPDAGEKIEKKLKPLRIR